MQQYCHTPQGFSTLPVYMDEAWDKNIMQDHKGISRLYKRLCMGGRNDPFPYTYICAYTYLGGYLLVLGSDTDHNYAMLHQLGSSITEQIRCSHPHRVDTSFTS